MGHDGRVRLFAGTAAHRLRHVEYSGGSEHNTETETQTRTDTGSGSGWVDENGDGIIGNDGTGYTEDSGSVTDDVESAADDLGRAVENGAEDVTDGVVGDTQTDRTTTDENTTTKR